MRAVLDRIEDNKAVILVESESLQYIVEKSKLPDDAKEGDVLEIEVTNDQVSSIAVNEEKTEATQASIQDKLKNMKSKKKGSKFKRK